jgi:quaternary ammonium compound-resistance protein SugE
MAWVYLVIAGLLEIAWAIGMKQSQGWTRLWPSVFTLVTMVISFWLLSVAMNRLPAGTAYAVWTGIGAAGTAILGIVYLKEPAGAARIACIVLIVAGVIGLKLAAGPEKPNDDPGAAATASAAAGSGSPDGEMADARR